MKKKINLSGIMVVVAFLILTLTLVACDDEDTYEVRLEDAKIAIDEGNYAAAKAILLSLPQTVEVKRYLSNAIAGGELNIDMFNIIAVMDDLEDADSQGSIDMIGLLVGDDNDELTAAEITSKLTAATEAIELYKDIAEMEGKDISELSDDQKVQLGLLSITRITLSMSSLISDELPEGTPVVMTETWIRENRENFPSLTPSDSELDRVGEDLTNIGYSITAIADSNDMLDDYTEFKNELDGNGDDETSAIELNNYIDSL